MHTSTVRRFSKLLKAWHHTPLPDLDYSSRDPDTVYGLLRADNHVKVNERLAKAVIAVQSNQVTSPLVFGRIDRKRCLPISSG